MAFVHLHVHTDYSLQDGLGKVKEYVQRAKELGMPAVAITDHGVGYGLPEMYSECKEAGITPVLGCEVYVASGSRFDKHKSAGERNYHHLILLVANETGYKNLCILISRSNTEGFYYKPRIDFELLSEHSEGLICLSGCVAGEIPQLILNGKEQEAKERALSYKNLFGENYYFEIQNHGLNEEATVAQSLIRMSKELGIKLVCTNDCHYVNSDDAEAHDWLICLQTGKKVSETDRMRYIGDYSLKSEEDMRALFPAFQEAFDNTIEILEKIHFDFEFGNYRMPKVVIPDEYGTDYFRYLEDEAWKGYEERYPAGHPEREEAASKLKYELSVVKQMGFAEYFLDTRKTIMWAKSQNILVGPGRGSAAGSVMCYSLKITDIDPIRYGLLFERFLNPERISMPDIDVDYSYSRKDDVIAFEAESNGKDRFAKIQTFGTMLAKGVLRDCARIAGYEPSTGSMLAKLIPDELGITLDKSWEKNPDVMDVISKDDGYKKLWSIARKLEGTKKSAGTHACGHIPTPVPCEELFPVSVDAETGYLICQYNMADAEHLGNLKKDLLMLRNLTIIETAHKEIKKRYGIDVPLWTDDILNDKEALALIAAGDTDGVFQLESQGMKNFMKDLKPDCFEDIIAGVSLYRPGPMDFIPQYIKGKREPESITYLTPELESILKPTYGVIVYQEQVMQIVQKLGGFSMGRADLVRKAMGKKKMAIMQAERVNFVFGSKELNIPGCVENGINQDIANQIYDNMIDFAKYAFNKSHAACYAAIAMQTAYLKAHYKTEFMTGLLSSVTDNIKKLIIYISACKRDGITILPPNVNESDVSFTIENNSIRFGLLAIKGVGVPILNKIVEERNNNGKYRNMNDIIKRIPEMGNGVAESLINAGAFDCFHHTRAGMLASVGMIISNNKQENKKLIQGQISMFDLMDDNRQYTSEDNVLEVNEFMPKELLQREKEATGLYFSGSPLDDYAAFIKKHVTTYAYELNIGEENEEEGEVEKRNAVEKGMHIAMAGVVKSVKQIYTKKGQKMAFLTMEDSTGDVSCVVFPDAYEKSSHILKEDAILFITGTAGEDKGGDVLNLLSEQIVNMETLPKKLWVRREIKVEKDRFTKEINKWREKYPGVDILITYDAETGNREQSTIEIKRESIDEIIKLYGKENVKMVI